MNDDNTLLRTEILEKRKWFCLFFDKCKVFAQLSDEQAGELIKAICKYAESGEQAEIENEVVKVLFTVFKADLDAGTEKYVKGTVQRIDAANKRWKKEKDSATACDRIQTDANKKKYKETDKEERNISNAASDSTDARLEMASLTMALMNYPSEQKPARRTAAEILKYYFDAFYEKTGTAHESIEPQVYAKSIFPKLPAIKNEKGDCLYNAEKHEDAETLELYKQIIDRHFETDYQGKTDYNIIHFVSGKIRAARYVEVRG